MEKEKTPSPPPPTSQKRTDAISSGEEECNSWSSQFLQTPPVPALPNGFRFSISTRCPSNRKPTADAGDFCPGSGEAGVGQRFASRRAVPVKVRIGSKFGSWGVGDGRGHG